MWMADAAHQLAPNPHAAFRISEHFLQLMGSQMSGVYKIDDFFIGQNLGPLIGQYVLTLFHAPLVATDAYGRRTDILIHDWAGPIGLDFFIFDRAGKLQLQSIRIIRIAHH